MKTFYKNDLITWSNRHDAKIKTVGYCANSINELKQNIENNITRMLSSISEDYERCFNCCTSANKETYNVFNYGFFLPKEAVKEEKIYRACRTIQELYELIFNTKSKADPEFYINELLGINIHFRNKENGIEYFTTISTITKDKNGCMRVFLPLKGYQSFKDFFEEYEIEVEGEFKPFGVLED